MESKFKDYTPEQIVDTALKIMRDNGYKSIARVKEHNKSLYYTITKNYANELYSKLSINNRMAKYTDEQLMELAKETYSGMEKIPTRPKTLFLNLKNRGLIDRVKKEIILTKEQMDEQILNEVHLYMVDKNIKTLSELEKLNPSFYFKIEKRKLCKILLKKLGKKYPRHTSIMCDDEIMKEAIKIIVEYDLNNFSGLESKNQALVNNIRKRKLQNQISIAAGWGEFIPNDKKFSQMTDEDLINAGLKRYAGRKKIPIYENRMLYINLSKRNLLSKVEEELGLKIKLTKIKNKTFKEHYKKYSNYSNKDLVILSVDLIKKNELRNISDLVAVDALLYSAIRNKKLTQIVAYELTEQGYKLRHKYF